MCVKKRFFGLLMTALLFGSMAYSQTKVIAHRGYWDYPGSAQNSIVALYKAHEVKAYGSEFDVSITADGIPVVNHDSDIQGFIIEKTNYERLRNLKLKNGEILPTLEQYLVNGKANKETKLILELKPHSTKEIEDRAVLVIVDLVRSLQLEDQVEYISFSMNICKEIIRLNPKAQVAYLKGDVAPAEVKKIGLTGIDYHYGVYEKNPTWIAEAKKNGLTINVWTVNKEDLMKKLIDQKVDFITTDKPELLNKVLGNK
jgi:glycerophosphoryl diester phosphodiesterase